MINLTNWYKRIGQRIVASSLVSTVLSLSMLAGPAYAVSLPGGIVDTNPDVEENTSVKDALKDVKKFLIEREPPFEPFFFRAAWGSAEMGGELKWDVNVTVNEGRLFIRKLLDAETGDTATRGQARFALGLNQMDVKTVTGLEGENTGYDGVMGIYRKPIGVDKDEIEFTFTAGDFKVTKTMEELQMDTFRSDEVAMGDKTGQTVYLDVINYDTKRGQFGKGRMELIFLNWGNVANLDMSVDTLAEAVDVTRNYVVTIGLENAEDTKLNYLATLGMEEDVEDFQIDSVLVSDNTQQVTVSSTVSGGTDATDGIVLALQGTFDAQEIPFMQRGITVRVNEVAGYDNFPEMEEVEETGNEEEEVETSENTEVTMGPIAFLPKDVTVSVGDTVKWTNTDSSPHTVTFDELNKSGNLDPGVTYERTFEAAGTFAYVCDYHQASGMIGTVTVTEAVSSVLVAQESADDPADDIADDATDDTADDMVDDTGNDAADDMDMPGDADGDGVLDDSDVEIEEEVIVEDIVDDTGQEDLNIEREVFAKTFMTTEEFGMYDFDDQSGYALRIMNGSFLWNNTPAVLKALLIIKSLQSLLFYLKWVATPAQLIALGGVGLVTAAYIAQVQEALFGETTISEEGLDELQSQVDKKVAQLKAQIMLAYDEDAISDVDTEEEAEEFADSDELDEAVEDIEQAGDDFEDDYNEEVADDGQQCYEEDICDFSDVPQAMAQGGTVVPTWFKDYVRLAVERGLVSGFKDASGKPTGAFHPGENVLMAQVLKVSLLANDIEFAYNESASYPEAGCEGAWYCTYVAACEAAFQDSPFCDIAKELPNFPASRAEVAGFMVGMGGVEANVDCSAEGVSCFPDSSYEKTYQTAGKIQYQPYIEHLHEAGCVSGVGETGMYVPPDLINRAAFAKIANCVAALSGVDPE